MKKRDRKFKGKRKIKDDFDNELRQLRQLFRVGPEEVVWIPKRTPSLSGEVKDEILYIYNSDRDTAIKTLRHEFIDYVITRQLIDPLVSIINLLIKQKEQEVYQSKERLIEKICQLWMVEENETTET